MRSLPGKAVKQRPIRDLLHGTGVNFMQGWVKAIDSEGRQVILQDQQISYDTLIYALGSHVDQERVPGIRDHAYVLNPGALDGLKSRLQQLKQSGGKVVVVGGGATGIEAAAEVKAFSNNLDVSIITQGTLGAFKNAKVEQHFKDGLSKQEIHYHEEMRVIEVREGELVLADRPSIPFDLCLWAGGFTCQPMAQDAGVTTDEHGRIITDQYMRSVSHPEIYAIGDAALPTHHTGAPVRMSILFAMTTGAHTADNITRMLKGKQLRPFAFSTYGQGISMGPNDGVGFMSFPNDQPTGPIIRGKSAVRVRNFFVWFLAYAVVIERHIPGFFLWFGKNRAKEKKVVSAVPVVQRD